MTPPFYSVYFTSTDTGFVTCESGDILKTTDGGTSWTTLANIPYAGLHSICFPNANTGYVVGFKYMGQTGLIYKTADGGQTWIDQSNPGFSGTMLEHVFFLNSDSGYAVGDNGAIIKTTDGGTNWSVHSIDVKYTFFSVCFPVSGTGYAVGWNESNNGAAMFKSTDDGLTWTEQTPFYLHSDYLWDVRFQDVNHGYAVGLHSRILYTADGGSNWTEQYTNLPDTILCLYSLCFSSSLEGYAVGSGGTIIKAGGGGTGVITVNAFGTGILTWPNPVNSSLCFSNVPVSEDLSFEIFDLRGKLLLSGILPENIQTINVSSLPCGQFLLKFSTPEKLIGSTLFVKW